MKRTNKLPMDTIMVARCPGATDLALATGNLLGSGNATTLSNGEIGVMSYDFEGTVGMGSFLTAGVTAAQVKAIQVVQGTAASANLATADPWQVGSQPYLSSGIIRRDKVRSIRSQKARPAIYGTTLITDLAASVPADLTEYRLYIKLDSQRNDRDYSNNSNIVNAAYTTPDYTALGLTSDLDHMLQHLAYDINKQSKLANLSNGAYNAGNNNVIALAIDIGGGAGQAIGAITCGTSITVMTDSNIVPGVGTVTADTTMVADEKLIGALAQAIAASNADAAVTAKITAASTIETIDLTTAGDVAGVDALLIIALDDDRAPYFDDIPAVMNDITVNPASGFQVTGGLSLVKTQPDEGVGQGWKWEIDSDNRYQLTVHNMQNRPHGDYFSEGLSYINPDHYYTSIIVEYYDTENTLTTEEQSPKTLTLLFRSGFTCANVTTVAPKAINNWGENDPASRVDLFVTVEGGCCLDCDPVVVGTNLQAQIISILLAWLKDADSYSGEGVSVDGTSAMGATSVFV